MNIVKGLYSMIAIKKISVYALLLISIYIILSFIPLSFDYDQYVTTTRSWLSGETQLYDSHSQAYYYMPWSLLITIPLSVFPDRWGQAILSLVSIIGIILSLRVLVGRISWWAAFIVLANLFTFNLLFSGQWDGLILGSIGIGWWSIKNKKPFVLGLSLLIMSTKPTNIFLVIGLLLFYIVRNWTISEIIKSILIPLFSILCSFFISGLEWPIRYMGYIKDHPPIPMNFNQSTWYLTSNWFINLSIIIILGIALIWLIYTNKGQSNLGDGSLIPFALLVNLLISSYVTTYHYIYTMPALGLLSQKKWYFSVSIYILMIVYLLGILNLIKSPPYLLYPLTILVFSFIAGGNIPKRIINYVKSQE